MNINNYMKKNWLGLWMVLVVGSVSAGTIVPYLNDSDALQTFGATSSEVVNTSGTLANGLTLAVDYTPTAGDITASAAPAPVLLLEIGTSGAGSGIYLANGGYWFVTKQNGNANYAAVDGSGNPTLDLDGTTGVGGVGNSISVLLGAAIAGTDALVWASFDNANGKIYGSVNGAEISYDVAGTDASWNWEGEGSLSFLVGTSGAYGGLAINGNAGVWKKGIKVDATGTAGDNVASIGGQYFNEVIPVPEPSTTAFVLLGLAGLFIRRRKT